MQDVKGNQKTGRSRTGNYADYLASGKTTLFPGDFAVDGAGMAALHTDDRLGTVIGKGVCALRPFYTSKLLHGFDFGRAI